MDKSFLEEMLRECEYMQSMLSARIERLRAMLGHSSGAAFAAPLGAPAGRAPDNPGTQIRAEMERRRQELMAQAEHARQEAMRQAQQSMSSPLGGAGAGVISGMPGMMGGASMLPMMPSGVARARATGGKKKEAPENDG